MDRTLPTANNSFIAGWYAIMPSRDLVKNSRPVAVERFGIALVLWRQKNGEISVLIDKCPHRGAKLSLGKIVDDTIRCPFHGYQFGKEGSCKFAPEFSKAIPGLRAQSLMAHEALEMIWLYWGKSPAPMGFNYPELEEIHQKFSGHFSATKKIWQSHITYCIENQLDYTHLKFVHHNTIGRGFKMPENPREVCGEDSIAVYFENQQIAAMKYYFPNAWVLNINDKMKLMLFFSPINQQQTQLYLRTYRKFMNYPGLKKIINGIMSLTNQIILKQDQQVVASQGGLPSYLSSSDLLMRYDNAIRYFRQRWRDALNVD